MGTIIFNDEWATVLHSGTDNGTYTTYPVPMWLLNAAGTQVWENGYLDVACAAPVYHPTASGSVKITRYKVLRTLGQARPASLVQGVADAPWAENRRLLGQRNPLTVGLAWVVWGATKTYQCVRVVEDERPKVKCMPVLTS